MKNKIFATLILSILIIGFAASSDIVLAASKVATPTFNPVAGTYYNALSVSISSTTTGAKIYYTLNDGTPSSSSTLYTGTPIMVSATTTIKAIAYKSGYTTSSVASATYTLVVATPTFNPVASTYSTTQYVYLSSVTTSAKIYYTLNDGTPSSSSTLYTGTPIMVSATTTIKAIAYKSGYTTSKVASATYTIIPSFTSFVLTAPTGEAYNTATHKEVAVSLSLSGSASGILPTIVNLDITGGDFNVAGYKTITVSSGTGYIISSSKYNEFDLIISGEYGGQVASATLTGTVTLISSNALYTKLSMTLSSNLVVLPFPGYPTLTNLHLTDTITLYT